MSEPWEGRSGEDALEDPWQGGAGFGSQVDFGCDFALAADAFNIGQVSSPFFLVWKCTVAPSNWGVARVYGCPISRASHDRS